MRKQEKLENMLKKNILVEQEFINKELTENEGGNGINFRSLLDGELAMAASQLDLNDYRQRNEFISKLENRLSESDWISMSNGTSFEKTFTPSQR